MGSLAPHVSVGEPAKLGVHDGRQRVERAVVAVAPVSPRAVSLARREHPARQTRSYDFADAPKVICA